MNKYIYLETMNRIINLEEAFTIGKIENKDQKSIFILYKDNKQLELDYLEIKDNINEEKTKIEQDFEKIKNIIFEEENKEIETLKQKIKNLEFLISCLKINSNKYHDIKHIIESKSINKLSKIEKIVKK